MTTEYYKIDVEIKSGDTLDAICSRFDQNSQKLYTICIAAIKQLAADSVENTIIKIVEDQYEDSRKKSTEEERLEKFTITTKEYRSNILNKDEEFFKNLGNILLDERRADIDAYMKELNLSNIVKIDTLINKVKSMLSRIDLVDSQCKSDIWRVTSNLIKLTEKYRIVKGYGPSMP